MNSNESTLIPLLTDIWEEALGRKEIAENDNFFAVGGDWDKSKNVAEKLTELFGEYIHSHAVYDAPTVSELAHYLGQYYPQAIAKYQGLDVPAESIPAARIDASDIEQIRRRITPLSPGRETTSAKNPTMVLLLSPPRSGSTLFRVMLGAHPQLFAPPELNLLSFSTLEERKEACAGRYAFLLEGLIRTIVQIKGCSPDEAQKIIADYEAQHMSTQQLYRILQDGLPDQILVERSTSYGLDIETLKQAETHFDQPRYIHLMRHPYGMIRSFEGVRFDRIFFRGNHPFTARQLGELLWVVYHQNISEFLKEIPTDRQLQVKFEDLVQQSKPVLERVCRLLDLPFHPGMLDPYQDKAARMADGQASEDPKFYQHEEIDPTVADTWKTTYSYDFLGDPTRELAAELGYDRPRLTEAERHKILVEWNATQTDHPREKCVHQLFEEQVERTPSGIAVVFEDQQLTYRELNQRANQLAHHLRKLGVKPEMPVGICLERSLDIAVAILGILKAGGAYVPLEPDYPKERLQFMLEDTQTPLLVTQENLLEELPDLPGMHHVRLDQDGDAISQEDLANPVSSVNARNLVYVIYTSGSTGQPKGTLIEHHSLCNLLVSHIETLGLKPGHRVLHFVSFSFDAATCHLFMALCSGAASVLTTKEAFGADPIRVLREHAISHTPLPASVLETIPMAELPALEVITVGAEACSADLATRWAKDHAFYNLYGPTETTILSTSWRYTPGCTTPPIGRPIANTQTYILDDQLEPVPIGVPGELHIGGVQLARGYLNRPELTAEKFIQNPFGEGRLYKTGDLTRYLPDGNLEFLGRIDDQVKVRGVRIELGEIEATLKHSPLVRQAVVVVLDNQLIAYVVPSEVDDVELRPSLRQFLQQRLPEHMIPAQMITLGEIPLTPAGKIDRKALPIPGPTSPDPKRDFVPPRTFVEKTLAGIWGEILEIEQVGVHDNFLELGGDSVLATKIVSRIYDAFLIKLPLSSLFRKPTVSDLVEELHKSVASEELEQRAQFSLMVANLSDEEISRMITEQDTGDH